MSEKKTRQKLLEAVQKEENLPPIPETVLRLRELIEDPESGIDDVQQIINSDPVLTGRLVQLANSVFAGGSGFVVTGLSRALSRLGLKMAMDVAYSLELPKMFSHTKGINQSEFWLRSLGIAVISSTLSKQFDSDREFQATAYLGGLMKKIGVLIFCHLIPQEYAAFLKKVQKLVNESNDQKTGIKLEILEQKVFGIDHMELGSKYVELWWPVNPKVIDFIRTRPEIIKNQKEHVVDIAELFLTAEKIPDGIIKMQLELPPEYVKTRFDISEENYRQMSDDLTASLKAMG